METILIAAAIGYATGAVVIVTVAVLVRVLLNLFRN